MPPPLKCPLCELSDCRPLAAPDHNDFLHCAICDLRFLHPHLRLSPTDEKARYESHQNDLHDPRYRNFLDPLLQAMRSVISPGSRGLDFGAGPGPALAEMLKEVGHFVDVYDPFYWPDSTKLEKQYDFVVASEVIEHLFDPAAEFARLFSLLRPGGYLGLMTLFVEPETDFANWYYRRDPTHVVFYSRQTLQWIASHFGFTELRFVGERVVTLRRPDVVSKASH
jgi:SAM-dependent methyltransferase